MTLYAQWAVSSYSLYKIIEATGAVTTVENIAVQGSRTYNYSVSEHVNTPCGNHATWALVSSKRGTLATNDMYVTTNTVETYTFSGQVTLQEGEVLTLKISSLLYGYHSVYITLTVQ